MRRRMARRMPRMGRMIRVVMLPEVKRWEAAARMREANRTERERSRARYKVVLAVGWEGWEEWREKRRRWRRRERRIKRRA